MPATVWFGGGNAIKDSIKYKYDSCGNICQVTENGHLTARYEYDSLNRLIREDNKALNRTVLYTYDNNGNIVERCEYDYTSKTGEELSKLECEHFSYDYDGDKFVSYNGESFAYNNLGNPTTYRNKAVTWQYGKYLASYNGTTFTYEGLGRRISKGNVSFTYDSDGRLIKQSNGLEFVYDNSGVIGVKYSGAQYFYRKDAQGNIIALLDSNGKVVVKYVYNAWGNHAIVAENGTEINSGIGILNPFRYRGYYYDTETGLYYLQTRYYDPEVGRFISQDSIDYADPETINGVNLYAYCGNNPVMNVDPDGAWDWRSFWQALGAAILVAVVVAVTAVAAVATGGVAGAAIMTVATGIAIGAIGGSVSAAMSGTNIAAGILGGAIKGGAVGVAIGLGIATAGAGYRLVLDYLLQLV